MSTTPADAVAAVTIAAYAVAHRASGAIDVPEAVATEAAHADLRRTAAVALTCDEALAIARALTAHADDETTATGQVLVDAHLDRGDTLLDNSIPEALVRAALAAALAEVAAILTSLAAAADLAAVEDVAA